MDMGKLVWTDGEKFWPIQLRQTSIKTFSVRYGGQLDKRLTYAEAAAKLGQAIMHRAACDGKLDTQPD